MSVCGPFPFLGLLQFLHHSMAALLATGWDAVNRFRKIEEATAPKDDPAPGTELQERVG